MIVLRNSRVKVTAPADVAKVFQDLLLLEDTIDRDKEHFYVMHLDTRNAVKLVELVGVGIVNASVVHPREIYRRAIAEGTVHIIIAHNHPSGETDPSAEDVAITRRVAESGRILDLQLLDHIIFSAHDYYSMASQNDM